MGAGGNRRQVRFGALQADKPIAQRVFPPGQAGRVRKLFQVAPGGHVGGGVQDTGHRRRRHIAELTDVFDLVEQALGV